MQPLEMLLTVLLAAVAGFMIGNRRSRRGRAIIKLAADSSEILNRLRVVAAQLNTQGVLTMTPQEPMPTTEPEALAVLQANLQALDETTTQIGEGVEGVAQLNGTLLARIDQLAREGNSNSTEAILANVQKAQALNTRLTVYAGILRNLAVDPADVVPDGSTPEFEDLGPGTAA